MRFMMGAAREGQLRMCSGYSGEEKRLHAICSVTIRRE